MATANIYGASSDADLQELIARLSGQVSQEDLVSAGLGSSGQGPVYDYKSPFTRSSFKQIQAQDSGTGNQGDRNTMEKIGDRASFASPSAALYSSYKNSKRKKKELTKNRAARAAYTEAQANFEIQRQASLEAVKREMQVRETKNQINGYFKSEKTEGLYDSLRSNVLQNSIADIINKYQDQLRDSSFQTAGQGLMGSSVDAERRGDIDKSQNTEAIQAVGNADRYVQGVRSQDDEQRRSLISTLSSDNPGDAAGLEQQTRGILSNTRNLNDQYASQAANRQTEQYGMNMQSQAFGNMLSNYANLYETGQKAQAYGGGSAF